MAVNFDNIFNSNLTNGLNTSLSNNKLPQAVPLKKHTTIKGTLKSSSLIEAEAQINTLKADLDKRIEEVFNKYLVDGSTNSLIEIPDYNILYKDVNTRFEISRMITEALDELLSLKIRISIMQKSINQINKIVANSRGEYALMSSFKNKMQKYNEELRDNKFTITEAMQTLKMKYKLVESVNYNT